MSIFHRRNITQPKVWECGKMGGKSSRKYFLKAVFRVRSGGLLGECCSLGKQTELHVAAEHTEIT
jgi:hypothetical protein